MKETNLYYFSRYPSRTEAVKELRELIDSGVLSQERIKNLSDICTCIEDEKYGLDLWGASYENVKVLFSTMDELAKSVNPDDIDTFHKSLLETFERYRMTPRKGSVSASCAGISEITDDCHSVCVKDGELR